MITGEISVKGVQFGFERRRYNGRKTFTWLYWRDEDDAWQEYKGDPWPSVTVPKRDLERIAADLKAEIDAIYGSEDDLEAGIDCKPDRRIDGSIQK